MLSRIIYLLLVIRMTSPLSWLAQQKDVAAVAEVLTLLTNAVLLSRHTAQCLARLIVPRPWE